MTNYILKEKPKDFLVNEIPLDFQYKSEGTYLIYKLTKTKYTTTRAIEQIGRSLKIRTRDIGFAGNKDKEAITTQLISIKNVARHRIDNLVLKSITLDYLGALDKQISLGDLKGNSFEITIKKIDPNIMKNINSNLNSIVNYFGEQRFSTINAKVGKLLLKKEFGEATNLICTNNHSKTEVEEHLEEYPHDYVGALARMNPRVLSMYVNSYQSYLWNKAVSMIIENKIKTTNEINISDQKLKICEKFEIEKIPLIGFETELEESSYEELLEGLLEEEGISQRDFITKQLPQISAGGSYRPVFIDVNNFKIINQTKSSLTISFDLSKGCYATVLIRHLFI